jgi:hypothetical protein
MHRRSDPLNPEVDYGSVERRYRSVPPGITFLDDLLTADALQALRRYCVESTIWFDFNHPQGYLGAYFSDGLATPLTAQIAEELPRRLPGIFAGAGMAQMWAYKYDSRMSGIALHADFAAVNVNFWITPDDANLSPGRSGLVLYDRRAPADWDFATYNTDQRSIRRFLRDSGAREIVIPYRCNRAIIFNSDLFHRTDDFRFRAGYADRRINVTMLYGRRSGR